MATRTELAKALAALTDAFLVVHGRFPLDRTTLEEVVINDAMTGAYRLIGQPMTAERARLMAHYGAPVVRRGKSKRQQ